MSQWIEHDFARPDPRLVQSLGKFSTGILGDCMNRLQSMEARIKPLVPGWRVVGPAFTVQSIEACNWGGHQALELAQPGDVLVISARAGTSGAVWGHVMTHYAKKRHLAGAVIDGCVRDAQENRADSFPLFCLGACPGGPHKGWNCNLNVAVSCAGVAVLPGDIIVGDDDGVVVVPQRYAAQVLQEAAQRAAKEEEWYQRMDAGSSTLELLGIEPVRRGKAP